MLTEEKRINTKEELRDWICYESQKYGATGVIATLRELFPIKESDVLRKHQVILRKTEYFVNQGNRIMGALYKIRLYRIQNKYALHIPINTCGRGLKVMHVGPILINGRATVGENCAFHINTALVAGGRNDDVPTLGDGVIVGIGATLVGGVYIADNVAIGANAVVNKDVIEENCAVAGVPAHKISDNGRLTWNTKAKEKNGENN